MKYEKEFNKDYPDVPIKNSQGEYDIDYVNWLESQLQEAKKEIDLLKFKVQTAETGLTTSMNKRYERENK